LIFSTTFSDWLGWVSIVCISIPQSESELGEVLDESVRNEGTIRDEVDEKV
jgi:hypothetical protein